MHQADIEVAVADVKRLLVDKAIVLIDCREPDEWEKAKIDGAVLMPMSNWPEESKKLLDYEGRHIVVHCHHGGRSLRVTRWLRQNGFPGAQNMTGGIEAWSNSVDPDVPRY